MHVEDHELIGTMTYSGALVIIYVPYKATCCHECHICNFVTVSFAQSAYDWGDETCVCEEGITKRRSL